MIRTFLRRIVLVRRLLLYVSFSKGVIRQRLVIPHTLTPPHVRIPKQTYTKMRSRPRSSILSWGPPHKHLPLHIKLTRIGGIYRAPEAEGIITRRDAVPRLARQ